MADDHISHLVSRRSEHKFQVFLSQESLAKRSDTCDLCVKLFPPLQARERGCGLLLSTAEPHSRSAGRLPAEPSANGSPGRAAAHGLGSTCQLQTWLVMNEEHMQQV